MKYIRLFNDEYSYNKYKSSLTDKNTPNLSKILDNENYTRIIKTTKRKYEDAYFTLVALEDTSFTFSRSWDTHKLLYSLDGGNTWVDENTQTITTPLIKRGHEVKWKSKDIITGCGYNGIGRFNSLNNKKFNVYGNILSLKYGDDFKQNDTLLESNFTSLFEGSSYLIDASNLILPSTISDKCYFSMFKNCKHLSGAPKLPSMTVNNRSYESMFESCQNLVTPPELPATNFTGTHVYNNMFYGCVRLNKAPELPATTLVNDCYRQMFFGCKSLTVAPELPAETLVTECYQGMFNQCYNLSYVKCSFTDKSASKCLDNWLSTTSSTGIFITSLTAGDFSRNSSGIPSNWIVNPQETSYKNFTGNLTINTDNYITFKSIRTSKIGLNKKSTYQSLYISKDKIHWRSFETTDIYTLDSLQSYYICGILSGNNNIDNNFTNFNISGNVEVYGNINSIFNYEDINANLKNSCCAHLFKNCEISKLPELPSTNLASNCYCAMFMGCNLLTDIPENLLPATTLSEGCYRNMFRRCSLITDIPENLLPATTLTISCYYGMFMECYGINYIPENLLPATTVVTQCYREMFSGCTFLKRIPNLPATTLAMQCYYCMFCNCESLKVPKELPATTLETSCYESMFQNCKSLLHIPNLPATTLADNCYLNMFCNCSVLTSIPENLLPVTTLKLNCYRGMFSGCNGLTEIPENLLPATTLAIGCYAYMFQNCDNLHSIPSNLLPATTLAKECYMDMFLNSRLTSIPSNLLPATELAEGCYKEMFRQNTTLVEIPANLLPAKSLAKECYKNIFADCTSLESVLFKLPATILAEACYYGMFERCYSLSEIPVNLLPATTLAKDCYRALFNFCSSLTTVPNNLLPATTLAENCYRYMFANCVSLVSSPDLLARTLVTGCYNQMFTKDSGKPNLQNLVSIKCLAEDISATDCLTNWVAGISSTTGTFIKYRNANNWPNGVNGIPNGWTIQNAYM